MSMANVSHIVNTSAPVTPNVSITVNDEWSASAINGITIIANGTTYTNTSGNTVYTTMARNGDAVVNISVQNESYWNRTYLEYNTSSDLAAELHQTEITFTATELITNNSLAADFTVNGTTETQFNLSAGSYNVTANFTTYIPKTVEFNVSPFDNITINITDMGHSLLNISSVNVLTSAATNNITGWVYHAATGFNSSFANETGNSFFFPIINDTFLVYLEAEGYAISPATNNHTIVVNDTTYNLSFQLFTNNSIYIVIRDATTLSLITLPLNVTVSSNVSEESNETSTGSLFYDQLADAEYTVQIEGSNYSLVSYVVTVTNRSTHTLNAYLSLGTSLVTFTFKDEASKQVLEGVTMSMSQFINGSWTVVESEQSDISGRSQFNYLPNVNYLFTATNTNYTAKTFNLNPIIFDSYDILLSKSTSLSSNIGHTGVLTTWAPTNFVENQTINFSWIISSPVGSLTSYNLTITSPNGTQIFTGTNANGENFIQELTFYNTSVLDNLTINYCYDVSFGSPTCFTHVYLIAGIYASTSFLANQGEHYGLGLLERVLIVTAITIFMAGVVTLFGNILLGVALGLFIMGFFVTIGFIPIWSVLPSLIVGLVMMWGRSS